MKLSRVAVGKLHPSLRSLVEEIESDIDPAKEQADLLEAAARRMKHKVKAEIEKHRLAKLRKACEKETAETVLVEICGSKKFVGEFGIIPNYLSSDPYEVLGCPRDADACRVKRQYMQLALLFHPDKNKHPRANQVFCSFTSAYAALKAGK